MALRGSRPSLHALCASGNRADPTRLMATYATLKNGRRDLQLTVPRVCPQTAAAVSQRSMAACGDPVASFAVCRRTANTQLSSMATRTHLERSAQPVTSVNIDYCVALHRQPACSLQRSRYRRTGWRHGAQLADRTCSVRRQTKWRAGLLAVYAVWISRLETGSPPLSASRLHVCPAWRLHVFQALSGSEHSSRRLASHWWPAPPVSESVRGRT
jgi:hypothetical protein